MRIDVIVNTTARKLRTNPALLRRMATSCGRHATLHPTRTSAQLGAVCQSIADRGTDLIVFSGGDGSYMAGITALTRTLGDDALPPIALLPGGTVSTVARNWGMTGDPAELLERLLDQVRRGTAPLDFEPRPTLRVHATTTEGVEARTGFIFGTGLVAKFFDLYYAGGAEGYTTAARITARVLLESFFDGAYARQVLDPLPCRIEVDGRPLAPASWSLVVASVVPDLGLNMRVTYRAGEDPQRLHCVASPLPSRQLSPRITRVLSGRSIGGDGHFDDLAHRLAIQAEGGFPYILDGDRLQARRVEVTAGPLLRLVSSSSMRDSARDGPGMTQK
ncbi:diacylglycerol/lipid kinase family protein [Chondromyces crocatus]|uniref:DAGKc domain-containing protein n=1 Tax=Chondromyces crocatus TaxID=52 RepID=A0A0K1ERA9_CHOCO|nr:diacylglycerol kinase family protein [Chondromyces crocatus]AKT43381.1 uncharacterized protein CMC5_076130 [Chondromyces crocatus]